MTLKLTNVAFFFIFWASLAQARECRPFEIYPEIKLPSPMPQPEGRAPAKTDSSGPLNLCLRDYLRQDFDKDGTLDWKIAPHAQDFGQLIPQDSDWDNDGILNLFDSKPFQANAVDTSPVIPAHLLLHKNPDHPLNRLQEKIYSSCGVLALNHTDVHSLAVLQIFSKICDGFLKKFKAKPYTFVLYAFAGHAHFHDVLATYYPEMNFMSIGGQLSDVKEQNEKELMQTIAHEVGHFLTFNFLSAGELASVAHQHGHWQISEDKNLSFYDSRFIDHHRTGVEGFFPSLYSRTNIHEWFSEVLSIFLLNHSRLSQKESLPKALNLWIEKKLGRKG